MVMPQKRTKVMMTNGFSRAAKKELGVSAEIICPRVTENSSQTRIIRNRDDPKKHHFAAV